MNICNMAFNGLKAVFFFLANRTLVEIAFNSPVLALDHDTMLLEKLIDFKTKLVAKLM